MEALRNLITPTKMVEVKHVTDYLIDRYDIRPGQRFKVLSQKRSEEERDAKGERMMAYRIETKAGDIVLYEDEIRHL